MLFSFSLEVLSSIRKSAGSGLLDRLLLLTLGRSKPTFEVMGQRTDQVLHVPIKLAFSLPKSRIWFVDNPRIRASAARASRPLQTSDRAARGRVLPRRSVPPTSPGAGPERTPSLAPRASRRATAMSCSIAVAAGATRARVPCDANANASSSATRSARVPKRAAVVLGASAREDAGVTCGIPATRRAARAAAAAALSLTLALASPDASLAARTRVRSGTRCSSAGAWRRPPRAPTWTA